MSKNNPVIIFPYLFEHEVQLLINKLNVTYLDYITAMDVDRIGPDMMYQKLWKQTDKDVIILHSDMSPLETDINNEWYDHLIDYANTYPEAGILGTKLLYPAQSDGKFIIQHAGGKFTEDGIPDHFG